MAKWVVAMASDEYGSEEFSYDSKSEAESGLKRLRKSAEEHEKEDGIQRWFRGPYEVVD